MNSFHLLLGSALLSLFVVSCETSGPSGGGSSGRTIMNPTVEQMARYEKEWGMEPRQVRPRNSGNYDTQLNNNTAGAQTNVPANSAPPPQPNMLPPAPEPVLDPASPSVDPATMQKLR